MATRAKTPQFEEHILSHLEDPLLVFDAKGKIWYANERFGQFSGYAEGEIIGKVIQSFLPPQEQERVLGALSQVVTKRRTLQDFHSSLLTKSGKGIPVSLYASPVKGSKKGFATLSDMRQLQGLLEGLRYAQESLQEKVAERTKELEAKTHDLENTQKALLNMLEDIQESRNRAEEERGKTSAIISGLTDGLLLVGKGGIVDLLNPAAENLLGVKESDIRGKTIAEFPSHPFLSALAKLLNTQKPREALLRKELQAPEQDGRSLEVTSVVLAGSERSFFIFHDITREKKNERLKTEFVSLSAHQLRTPLSAIKWALHMFLDEETGPLSQEQKELVKKAYQSNERMIELINDLLDVTRIEEGRYLSYPQFSKLDELARSVVQLYEEEARRRNITLVFQAPLQKLPRILIDAEKIKIVIQNLLDNALRYTSSGGKVILSFSQSAQKVRVSIQDTGMGIPQVQQAQVFERFFRAANAKKVDTEGSGLGLYIAKNIVQAHGGEISFTSEEGKGTTFTFSLPAK